MYKANAAKKKGKKGVSKTKDGDRKYDDGAARLEPKGSDRIAFIPPSVIVIAPYIFRRTADGTKQRFAAAQ